jgi:hypothetical protein
MTGGNSDNQSVPVVSGSMEIALNRFMLAQVEVASSRWANNWTVDGRSFTQGGAGGSFNGYTGNYVGSDRYRQTELVGNFLGRAGSGRVHALFGAGFGIAFTGSESTSTRVGCIPAPLMPCPTSDFHSSGSYTDFVQQFVGGVDVRLTTRLTAYATVRAHTLPDHRIAALAGLRATIRRAPVGVAFSSNDGQRSSKPGTAPRLVPPADALGKEVHVVELDHSRQTGRLVSIDDRQVTISRPDGQVSIPKNEVQGVRLVSHVFRNSTMIGLGVGFGAGLVYGGSIEEGGGSYALPFGLMFAGIGAGAGAAIGAVANLSGAGRRTIYIGPAKTALNLAPVLGKGRVGFTGLISW